MEVFPTYISVVEKKVGKKFNNYANVCFNTSTQGYHGTLYPIHGDGSYSNIYYKNCSEGYYTICVK